LPAASARAAARSPSSLRRTCSCRRNARSAARCRRRCWRSGSKPGSPRTSFSTCISTGCISAPGSSGSTRPRGVISIVRRRG
jgi:hypothetical protein